MRRILVVTPQHEELEPFLRRLSVLGHMSSPVDVGRLGCFEVPSLGVVAAAGGHGKAQLALQSQYLIDRLGKLDAILCLGAAGSLSETLRLGDVVVGTTTVEHDYKLRFIRAPLPNHPATPSLLDEFRELAAAPSFGFRVYLGAIASGDEDVVDSARAAELRAATGALCVAWEGSGAARVAAFNALNFLEIRCITDGADPDASVSFHEHCSGVMPNAADLILRWLSSAVVPALPFGVGGDLIEGSGCEELPMSQHDAVNLLLAEQIAYYRAIAPEYESLSIPGGGGHEVTAALDVFRPAGNVLELACGPGMWTELLLRAASVTAVDAAPEMLALARVRVGEERVRFVQADLFSWRPDRRYDVVFFGFWLSHVPRDRFEAFWSLVGDCLEPAGRVFFVDDAFRPPEELIEGESSSTIQRRLGDGTPYRVVKVPYRSSELEQQLALLGWRFTVAQTSGSFYWGTGRRGTTAASSKRRVGETPSTGPTVLRGVVRSGLGDCGFWLAKLQDDYRAKTGMKLFPGTLNLELAEPFQMSSHPIRLEAHEYGGTVSVSIIPCRVFGRRSFILRTDANERGTGDHPRTIVEIATDVNLRDAYDLADGALVEIELEPILETEP